jgi:hypothetical protein
VNEIFVRLRPSQIIAVSIRIARKHKSLLHAVDEKQSYQRNGKVKVVSPEENTQHLTEHRLRTFRSSTTAQFSGYFLTVPYKYIWAILTTFQRYLLSATWFVEHWQYSKHLQGAFTQKENKNLKTYVKLLIKALEMLDITC